MVFENKFLTGKNVVSPVLPTFKDDPNFNLVLSFDLLKKVRPPLKLTVLW